MRLAEVHIEGFGRLVNRHLSFSPGLNLVVAPNEAGKSTLLQALVALLYGLPEPGPLAACKPWDAADFYAGSLTYVLDDGQGYRASRRFLPRAETTLRTHPEGADVSAGFKRADEGLLLFADEQLGLGREVYEAVGVVRQAELTPLAAAAGVVTGHLTRRLAAAGDAMASQALARVEGALREQVDSGPLAQAQARLKALEEERRRGRPARQKLLARVAALDQAREQLTGIDRQREALLASKRRAEQAAARAQQSAGVEATAREVARGQEEVGRWQAWATFPVQLSREVSRLAAERRQLAEECAEAERRAGQTQFTLEALEAQEAALQERLAALGGVQEEAWPGSPEVDQLVGAWRAAVGAEAPTEERWRPAQTAQEALQSRLAGENKALEPVMSLGLEGLVGIQERLRSAQHRLGQAKAALREASARWARSGADEGQFVQAVEVDQKGRSIPAPGRKDRRGGGVFSAFRGAGARKTGERAAEEQAVYDEVVRCRTEAEIAERALRDLEAAILWQLGGLMGGTLAASAFDKLRERLEHHLEALAEVERQTIAVAGLRSELDQARERRETAESALRAQLGGLAIEATDIQQALAIYQDRRQRKSRGDSSDSEQGRLRRRIEADLELLHLRTEALQGEVRRWRDLQAELAGNQSRLEGLLAQGGTASASATLEEAIGAFSEGCENYRRWEKAKAALEAATRYQQALLDAQASAASTAALLQDLDSKLGAGPGEAPTEPDRPAEEYDALLRELDGQRAKAAEACAQLEEAFQLATAGLRHPAEIEEEIAAARAEVQGLERFRQTLQLAREELAQAGQEWAQQFTTRLEALVGDGLKRITADRYVEVTVDPATLAVAVQVPELGTKAPAEDLSAATRDLVYLLLRLGIARLIGHSGEKLPLLLDDPLVRCDQDRRRRALDYLARLAEGTQVFLFTGDERIRAWFDKECRAAPQHQVLVLG